VTVWGNNVQGADLLKTLNGIAASLSFFGSFFMCYFCLRIRPRTVSLKFILSIAIADVFFSIANLMSEFEYPSSNGVNLFCGIEAFIRAGSYVLSVFFASCIAVLCYKTSALTIKFDQETCFRSALYIGGIIVLILAILPAVVNPIAYTNGDIYCYITYASDVTSISTKLIVRMIYEGIPILAGVLITLIGYILTIRKIKKLPPEILEELDISIYKLFWYPALLFVTFVPSILDNYAAIYTGSAVSLSVKALHLSITHLIGFTNAILYGIQRKLYHTKHKEPNIDLSQASSRRSTSMQGDLLKAMTLEP